MFEVFVEEIRKRVSIKKEKKIYLQEVGCREQEARFVGIKGRRYNLWSENNDGIEGVGILVKHKLCEDVLEVPRKSDRVFVIVLVFEESHICVCSTGKKIRLQER